MLRAVLGTAHFTEDLGGSHPSPSEGRWEGMGVLGRVQPEEPLGVLTRGGGVRGEDDVSGVTRAPAEVTESEESL